VDKNILFVSSSSPEEPGYCDWVSVIENNQLLFHSWASVCPNPRKPILKGGAHWRKAYAFLKPCQAKYTFRCIQHYRYGKCILINDGGPVPTRYPNPNQKNQYFAKGVFAHKGWSRWWRGSAGCLTIPPDVWRSFMRLFEIGETGTISIIDYTKLHIIDARLCMCAKFCPIYQGVQNE